MDLPWVIERLDRKRHERVSFDCGNIALNRWLAERAAQHEDRDLARTYVATLRGESQVKGFYAVSSHHVAIEVLDKHQAKGLPPRQQVPVVLLGKLAVCRSAQGLGLGRLLLTDALCLAERVARDVGARAVEVDAVDRGAQSFYLKFGFTELLDDPFHLYLPVRVIRKMNLPPWTPK